MRLSIPLLLSFLTAAHRISALAIESSGRLVARDGEFVELPQRGVCIPNVLCVEEYVPPVGVLINNCDSYCKDPMYCNGVGGSCEKGRFLGIIPLPVLNKVCVCKFR